MPDATGLELIAQELREQGDGEAVLGTVFFRERATLLVTAQAVPATLAHLRGSWTGVPALPDDVVVKTREKYVEAFRRLTGRELT